MLGLASVKSTALSCQPSCQPLSSLASCYPLLPAVILSRQLLPSVASRYPLSPAVTLCCQPLSSLASCYPLSPAIPSLAGYILPCQISRHPLWPDTQRYPVLSSQHYHVWPYTGRCPVKASWNYPLLPAKPSVASDTFSLQIPRDILSC